MIESIFQTFILLGTFDIILISVSIANYAISASYLGRETRLTRGRMEKRKKKLDEKIKELQAKELSIKDLEVETTKAKDDMTALKRRLFFLSWSGAILLPSSFYLISIIFAVLGMNSDILIADFGITGPTVLTTNLMTLSVGFLAVGFFSLLIVIGVIDSAARKIPIPELEVFFQNNAKSISIKRNAKQLVRLFISNEGEDIAENVVIYAIFPSTFIIHESPQYSFHRVGPESRYEGGINVTCTLDLIHISVVHNIPIVLTAPDEKKKYSIIISIRERKTEATKHQLSIEVVD
jgi:hypothetical protein